METFARKSVLLFLMIWEGRFGKEIFLNPDPTRHQDVLARAVPMVVFSVKKCLREEASASQETVIAAVWWGRFDLVSSQASLRSTWAVFHGIGFLEAIVEVDEIDGVEK